MGGARRLVGRGVEGGAPALGEALVQRGERGLVGKIDDAAEGFIAPRREALGNEAFERYLKSTGATQKQLGKMREALGKEGVLERAKEIAFKEIPEGAGLPKGSIGFREENLKNTNDFRLKAGKRVEAAAEAANEALPLGVDVRTISKEIDKLADKYSTVAERPVRDKLKQYARELTDNYATKDADGSILFARAPLKEINRERMALDDIIYHAEYGLKDTQTARALQGVRSLLQDNLMSNVEAATKGLPKNIADEWKAANLDYHISSKLTKAWAKGVDRDAANRTFSLSTVLGAGHGGIIGSVFGGPLGAIAGTAVGTGASWMTRTMGDQIMAQSMHALSKGATISEVSSMTAKEIVNGVRRAIGGTGESPMLEAGTQAVKGILGPVKDTAIKTIRTGTRVAAGTASAGLTLGKIETIRALTPKKYQDIRSQLIEQKNDPTLIATQVMSTGIPEHFPEVGRSLIDTAQRGNNFLVGRLPPELTRPSLTGPKPVPPNADQLREFAKYVRAVDDPLSILEDLKDGDVDPKTVEAIRTVYPKLYAEVEAEVRLAIAADADRIPYQKKISLGIMFGEAVDPTLTPEYMKTMRIVSGEITDGSNVPNEMLQPAAGRKRGGGGTTVESLIRTISPPPKHALRPTPSLASRAQRLSDR
jgi:hypothetical protein